MAAAACVAVFPPRVLDEEEGGAVEGDSNALLELRWLDATDDETELDEPGGCSCCEEEGLGDTETPCIESLCETLEVSHTCTC